MSRVSSSDSITFHTNTASWGPCAQMIKPIFKPQYKGIDSTTRGITD